MQKQYTPNNCREFVFKGNTYKCFRNESSDVCDICSCEICECTCSKVKEEKEKKEGEEEKEGEEGGHSGEKKEVETTKAQCKDECDKKERSKVHGVSHT